MLPHDNVPFVRSLCHRFEQSNINTQRKVLTKLTVMYTIATHLLSDEWGCPIEEVDKRLEEAYYHY